MAISCTVVSHCPGQWIVMPRCLRILTLWNNSSLIHLTPLILCTGTGGVRLQHALSLVRLIGEVFSLTPLYPLSD